MSGKFSVVELGLFFFFLILLIYLPLTNSAPAEVGLGIQRHGFRGCGAAQARGAKKRRAWKEKQFRFVLAPVLNRVDTCSLHLFFLEILQVSMSMIRVWSDGDSWLGKWQL